MLVQSGFGPAEVAAGNVDANQPNAQFRSRLFIVKDIRDVSSAPFRLSSW
jgi:hypothetical protein